MDVDIDTEPAVVVPEPHAPDTHAEDALVSAEAAQEHAGTGENTDAPSAERAKSRAARPSAGAQNGVSVFPVARVSKIIKADSAVDICSKEATFLISVASVRTLRCAAADQQELLVRHMMEESCTNARLDKRKIVRYDDIGAQASEVQHSHAVKAVQQNEHLDFLRDVIPPTVPLSYALQQREVRPDNPELQRFLDADAGQKLPEAQVSHAAPGKPRAVRRSASRTKAPSETPKESTVEERSAQRAARRQSRSGAETGEGSEQSPDAVSHTEASPAQNDALPGPTEAPPTHHEPLPAQEGAAVDDGDTHVELAGASVESDEA